MTEIEHLFIEENRDDNPVWLVKRWMRSIFARNSTFDDSLISRPMFTLFNFSCSNLNAFSSFIHVVNVNYPSSFICSGSYLVCWLVG